MDVLLVFCLGLVTDEDINFGKFIRVNANDFLSVDLDPHSVVSEVPSHLIENSHVLEV